MAAVRESAARHLRGTADQIHLVVNLAQPRVMELLYAAMS
jgi:hypothetical protein